MKDRIKQIRKDAHMTMEKFGEQIGITKSSVSLLESGKNCPSEQTIKLICKEFGINEDWLRTGKGDMYVIPEDETAVLVTDMIDNEDSPFYSSILRIMKIYKELDPKAQDAIDDLLKKLLEIK